MSVLVGISKFSKAQSISGASEAFAPIAPITCFAAITWSPFNRVVDQIRKVRPIGLAGRRFDDGRWTVAILRMSRLRRIRFVVGRTMKLTFFKTSESISIIKATLIDESTTSGGIEIVKVTNQFGATIIFHYRQAANIIQTRFCNQFKNQKSNQNWNRAEKQTVILFFKTIISKAQSYDTTQKRIQSIKTE